MDNRYKGGSHDQNENVIVAFVKAVENVPEGVQFDADALSLIKTRMR